MEEAKFVRIRGEWAMSVSKSTCVGKFRRKMSTRNFGNVKEFQGLTARVGDRG